MNGPEKSTYYLSTAEEGVEKEYPKNELPEIKIVTKINNEPKLEYQVYERAPIFVSIFVALQHILMSLGSCLSMAFIISDSLCVSFDHPIRTKLFSSTMFMCGVSSILQTFFGVRLPIYQGPSASFIVPVLALKRDASWFCPSDVTTGGVTGNVTMISSMNSTDVRETLSMEERLQELSGSLMVSSIIEVLIGGLGLVGPLLKYIGPITVAPTISLIGLSLVKVPIIYSRPQWALAFSGALLVLIFSLYLFRYRLPIPRISCRKQSKPKPRFRFALFQILPADICRCGITLWIVFLFLRLPQIVSIAENPKC